MKIVYGLLYAFIPALVTLLPAILTALVALTVVSSEVGGKLFNAIIFGPIIASATYIITAIIFCIVKEPKLLLPRISGIAFICSLILLILFICMSDGAFGRWN